MNAFYSTDITSTAIVLSDQEARHCTKVLRKNLGDKIHVLDGKGSIYESVIKEIGKHEVELEILGKKSEPRNEQLPEIAFGLLKNSSRMEWMLEKLTEIGVRRIIPLRCQRSERKRVNLERWNKILLSAMKQSIRKYLPILEEPSTVSDLVKSTNSEFKYIASFGPGVPELVSQKLKANPIIMIGPEGDFDTDEMDLAMKEGFRRVNLGQSRLRAETAAIVACTIMNNRSPIL